MAGITIRSSRPSYKGKYYKGGKWNKPLTKTAKKQVVRIVRSQQETKFRDASIATSVSYNGVILPLSDIPVGTGDTERIGDKIKPVSIQLRGNVVASDNTNMFRMVVFRWKPSFNADTPIPSEILQVVGSTSATNSPYNHDRRSQFTVVKDVVMNLDLIGFPQKLIKFSKKLTGSIKYNSGSTTDAMNGLYVLFISDSAAIPHPGFDTYFRISYKDA